MTWEPRRYKFVSYTVWILLGVSISHRQYLWLFVKKINILPYTLSFIVTDHSLASVVRFRGTWYGTLDILSTMYQNAWRKQSARGSDTGYEYLWIMEVSNNSRLHGYPMSTMTRKLNRCGHPGRYHGYKKAVTESKNQSFSCYSPGFIRRLLK